MKPTSAQRWAAAVFGLCALARVSTLHAQAPVADAPAENTSAPVVTPEAPMPDAPTPDAAVTEPERLYHLAFVALADGDHALAQSLLQELIAKHPEDAMAQRARSLVALIEQPAHASAASTATPPAATEAAPEAPPRAEPAVSTASGQRPTGAARAELVFMQTVYGIALGAELCAIAECEDGRAWIGMLMVGGGAGFGISYVASHKGVTPGLARALTDGALWGLANGFFLMLATDGLGGDEEESTVFGAHFAVGQLAGLGVAGLLYSQLEPRTGQVSLTSSGGIWSLAITAQLLGALDADLDGQAWGGALLAAGDLGLVAGAALAMHQPMSASRVLMIDAGGLLGGLLGLGVSVLAQEEPEPTPTFTTGLIGTVSGLGLTYYLTQSWDTDKDTREEEDDGRASLGLVPVRGGAMAMGQLRY